MLLDKTEKGREEIATRKYRLSSRLRTLLLLIDGKNSIDDLLDKLSGIGLTEDNLRELIEGEFVYDTLPPPPSPPSEPSLPTEQEIASKEQRQLDLLYAFYTDTIKSAIGLRGYSLQARVERARSVEDFRELRQSYLEAVLRAQGETEARRLRDLLDPLLNGALPPEG